MFNLPTILRATRTTNGRKWRVVVASTYPTWLPIQPLAEWVPDAASGKTVHGDDK